MKKIILPKGISHYSVSNDNDIHLVIEQDGESFIEILGEDTLNLNWKVTLNQDVDATVFFYNSKEKDLNMHLNIELMRNANGRFAYLECGTGKINLTSRIDLKEEGASANFHSATIAQSPLQFDIETIHSAKNTTGHMENYGLALKDVPWSIVCAGRINKYSTGSESRQESRILTYEQPKSIKVLPILYIDENDVIASHANTLGQPDDEVLYYMEARGLDRNRAMGLLAIGYLMPIAKVCKDGGLQKKIAQEITKRVEECQFLA